VTGVVLFIVGCSFADSKKSVTFAPGKSYTACSPGTPPGLDRSNGTGL